MRDVLVLCEGHSEREFCKRLLAEHVAKHGIALAGTLAGKPQRKRGGIQNWERYRNELVRHAKERKDRFVGLLVDYYAMPMSWPGRREAHALPPEKRGTHVEQKLRKDLEAEVGGRFLPCVQLHEFEALLFVDPERTARTIAAALGIGSAHAQSTLTAIKGQFAGNVERIDDSYEKSPARRIASVFPSYDKVAWGVAAVQEIGVERLRDGCPWLDRWISAMLGLAETPHETPTDEPGS